MKRRIRAWAAVAIGALLVGPAVLTAPAQAAAMPTTVVPAPNDLVTEPLPTVQIDSGVVWSQAVIGNRVYAGGSFANTRPAGAKPGQSLTPRANLLAYDIDTGELIESFAPQVNGVVKTVVASPDGTRLYIGGTFTQVDGLSRWHVAALDARTGKPITSWKPAVGGSYVNAIAVSENTVYLGGLFTQVSSTARKNIAAVTSSGALTTWAPTVSGQIDTMILTPSASKLVIGGRFGNVNGSTRRGLAALRLTDGALAPWAATSEIVNGGLDDKSGIWSLSTDGVNVYGTGWNFNGLKSGNLEGTFAAEAESGALRWIEDCRGDTYGAYSDGKDVYTVGHAHDCSTMGGYKEGAAPAGSGRFVFSLAFSTDARGTLGKMVDNPTGWYKNRQGTAAPDMYGWYQNWTVGTATGMNQAAWSVTGTGDYVLYGGEFQALNGTWQQGLVRFARPGFTPNTELTAGFTSSVAHADLSVDARRSAATPGHTITSYAWEFGDGATGSGMSATHTYATGGAYRVTLTVTDDAGQAATTAQDVVVPGPPPPYAGTVAADGALAYWRLDETGGPVLADELGLAPMSTAQAKFGAPGAVAEGSAITFDGAVASLASTQATATAPTALSVEAWFTTTTTKGGKIVGFENKRDLSSTAFDRHVYMSPSGKVSFGVYNGSEQILTSPTALNDGTWHHVVGTLGAGGMSLYVDGVLVGTKANVTSAQSYSGYWHIGGGTTSKAWGTAQNWNIAATIDEVAVYPHALTAEQVARHHELGGR